MAHLTKIGVEEMGELADRLADPSVLRLENLDTDLRPPPAAVEVTRRAATDDDANSYLPFFGLDSIRRAASARVSRTAGRRYDWKTECIICAGGLSGILNVLLATVEPGDRGWGGRAGAGDRRHGARQHQQRRLPDRDRHGCRRCRPRSRRRRHRGRSR